MSKIAQDENRLPNGVILALILTIIGLIGALAIWWLPRGVLEGLFKHIRQVIDMGGGYLVLFPFFIIFIKKVYKKNIIELCFGSKAALKDILLGLGASPLLMLLLLVENSLLTGGVYLPEGYLLILFIIIAVSLGPIVEEAFYRGVIYSLLRRQLGIWWGLSFSALIFALSHFPSGVAEWVPYILTGVPLALLYEWRKTLLPSIVAHAGANLGTILWGLAFY